MLCFSPGRVFAGRDVTRVEEIEEGVFEDRYVMALRARLSLFWDVGLFQHVLTVYAQRGDECDV
jgi:hypothetical protein